MLALILLISGCANNENSSISHKDLLVNNDINECDNLNNPIKIETEVKPSLVDEAQISSDINELELRENELNTLEVLKLDESVLITIPRNDHFVVVEMKSVGVNELFGFSKIDFFKNDELQKELTVCTDWIGPYMVRSISCSDDKVAQFTGGWHGTNGDGTGEPTAETLSVVISYEGIALEENQLYRIEAVDIEVSNIVNAYNDCEPAIMEVITYSFEEEAIYISVEIEALTEIEISKYYGLQTQNSIWDGTIEYRYRDGNILTNPLSESSQSDAKNVGIVQEYVLNSTDHEFSLSAGIIDVGLGKFEYLGNDNPSSFTLDYGKSYFNLINGESLQMCQGEKVYWEGYYIFE